MLEEQLTLWMTCCSTAFVRRQTRSIRSRCVGHAIAQATRLKSIILRSEDDALRFLKGEHADNDPPIKTEPKVEEGDRKLRSIII